MNIYSHKIDRIIDILSPSVLTLYPSRSSNRLYLIFAIEYLLQAGDIQSWREHAALLRQGININDIIEKEFKNKSLFLEDGVTGFKFVLNCLFQIKTEHDYFIDPEKIMEKIGSSYYWEEINKGEKEINLGIYYGISGLGLGLLGLINNTSFNIFSTKVSS